ncbi:hypothetical protein D9M68_658930 [compost metagenome]
MMASKVACGLKSCNAVCITDTRSAHGLLQTFCAACVQASSLISIAVILDWGNACASIRLSNPVPAPISRIEAGYFWRNTSASQAPCIQASVLTFIAQRSCAIRNCLKSKYALGIGSYFQAALAVGTANRSVNSLRCIL